MGSFYENSELNMSGALEVSWYDKPRLHTMVAKLSDEIGIRKPKVFVVPGDQAAAYGNTYSNSDTVIAVTEAMLSKVFPEQRAMLVKRELNRMKQFQEN